MCWLNGSRVLVVDDHDDCRELMADVLRACGYDVVTANNGAEGLAAAKIHRPFAIVTDIGMPVMNGFAFAQAIRSDPAFGETFIIAVSGWAETERALKAYTSAFDRRFVKPADIVEIVEALEYARNDERRVRTDTATKQMR